MFSSIQAQVESRFSKIADRHDHLCDNPVTGQQFMYGKHAITIQKEIAYKALRARDWFAEHGPPGAPSLPLSFSEIEDMKYAHLAPKAAFNHIISCFATSLQSQGWD